MKSKIYPRCILLLVGALLWTLYLCQNEMARYGIYTLFSYSFHEVFSFIPILGFGGTLVWLAAVLIRGRKARDWKRRIPFAVLLLLLLIGQTVYLVGQSQLRTMTMIVTVVSSDSRKEELVVTDGEQEITLECPMLVQEMVVPGAKKYQINYEYKYHTPEAGKLCMIKLTDG